MAQQLVLVPKVKYEYLLKKVGEKESTFQSGKRKSEEDNSDKMTQGQNDEFINSTDSISDDTPRQETIKHPDAVDKVEAGSKHSKRLNLFVEAPLSKMGFTETTKLSNKKRKVSRKSPAIKRTDRKHLQ